MPTTTSFDLGTLRQGIEGRDPEAMLSLYADSAEVTEVDKDNPPDAPRVFRGKEAIAEHLREVCDRDMTHQLERPVVADDRLAFTEACRYADGTQVLCMATADLDGAGKIVRQVAVTAWKE
ncbi:MAG: nuclear transport factor 2 family protein [Actinomycetota bacterium]|nr:nuclear transport factor 2 family protein [Actinomycetota bacterium]